MVNATVPKRHFTVDTVADPVSRKQTKRQGLLQEIGGAVDRAGHVPQSDDPLRPGPGDKIQIAADGIVLAQQEGKCLNSPGEFAGTESEEVGNGGVVDERKSDGDFQSEARFRIFHNVDEFGALHNGDVLPRGMNGALNLPIRKTKS